MSYSGPHVDLIHGDDLCTYPGEINEDGTRCTYCGAEMPSQVQPADDLANLRARLRKTAGELGATDDELVRLVHDARVIRDAEYRATDRYRQRAEDAEQRARSAERYAEKQARQATEAHAERDSHAAAAMQDKRELAAILGARTPFSNHVRAAARAAIDRAENAETRAASWWETAKTYARHARYTQNSVTAWANWALSLNSERYQTLLRAERAEQPTTGDQVELHDPATDAGRTQLEEATAAVHYYDQVSGHLGSSVGRARAALDALRGEHR